MAQSLYTLDGVYYVAGRSYSHNGVQYQPGDVVPDAKSFRNVEAMVRSRHLILVVDNPNDVPVYFQKDVKQADLVELKFGLKIKHPKKQAPAPEPVAAPKPQVQLDPAPKKRGRPRKDQNDA